ncbi:hypothetical protein HELRODRAFT_190756, partial [Helobdella robusta]|uniref:Uncharacterized protein n=1 Tax=Helobdella robusta TaxID=6412 RepID=T1FS97_HELRO
MSKNNQDFTLSLLKTIASVPINKKSQSNIHRIIETAEKKIGLRAERTKHLLKNLASRRLIKEVKHKGEISYRVLKTNLNKYLNSVGSTMNDVEDVLEAGVSDEELPANNDGAVANEAADHNEEGEKRIKRTTRRKVLKAVRSLWKLLNKKQAVVIVKPRSRGRPPKQKNEYNLAKTSQVGKQLEEGVSFNQIQSWFLRKWPCQVNDVKEIEMAINLEVESGRLILLPNNNYILKNWNTTLKDSNTNGDDDDDENGATNWESIIVEPEGRNISGVGNSCF